MKLLHTVAVLAAIGHSTVFANIILQLGPGGAASLVNSSPGDVILESYSIAGSNLSPADWDSLDSQGFAFAESSATSSLLSEQALTSGLLFGPGESRLVGLPFVLDLVADGDGDGAVDLDDLNLVRNNFGATTSAGAGAGDFNLNGVVDLPDLNLVRDTFGAVASYTFSANTRVPVPDAGATAGLLAMAVGGLATIRRRMTA